MHGLADEAVLDHGAVVLDEARVGGRITSYNVCYTKLLRAVTSAAAAAFGLPAGLPVIAGTLDSAAELVGCGILTPSGTGMVMVGSSGGIMGVTAHSYNFV